MTEEARTIFADAASVAAILVLAWLLVAWRIRQRRAERKEWEALDESLKSLCSKADVPPEPTNNVRIAYFVVAGSILVGALAFVMAVPEASFFSALEIMLAVASIACSALLVYYYWRLRRSIRRIHEIVDRAGTTATTEGPMDTPGGSGLGT